MDSAAFFMEPKVDYKEVVKSTWNRKRASTTPLAVLRSKLQKECQHKLIQVVLNPSSSCVITASVTNDDGHVLANVCVLCSDLKKESCFGIEKKRKINQATWRVWFEDTEATLYWFRSSPFTKAHANQDGIHMYTCDKSIELPAGARWERLPSIETICIGRPSQDRTMNRQSTKKILADLEHRLALKKMLDSE
jgi:hypothetical protein